MERNQTIEGVSYLCTNGDFVGEQPLTIPENCRKTSGYRTCQCRKETVIQSDCDEVHRMVAVKLARPKKKED